MAIRSQLEIDTIIGNGQITLGDLSLKYVNWKINGTGNLAEMKDDAYRLILLDSYLDTVIDPDTELVKGYLQLPQYEIFLNHLLDAIYKLSDIFDIPGVPITGRRRLPLIFEAVGLPGTPGVPGNPGSNADIVVESDPDYDNIAVSVVTLGATKTYKLGYSPYTVPQAFIDIQGSKLFEIGDVVSSLTIIVGSIKGRQLITRREIMSPGGIVLTNPDLNMPGLQQENVIQSNVGSNTTYTLEVQDENGSIATDSDAIAFVYPFLYGRSEITGIDHYQDLTKLIAVKSDKQIVLNGTDDYFWFGYPASYGDLTRILDQNGFNVTSAWTKLNINVSSANLDNNWVNVAYIFYRHTLKSTINSGLYTFDFP